MVLKSLPNDLGPAFGEPGGALESVGKLQQAEIVAVTADKLNPHGQSLRAKSGRQGNRRTECWSDPIGRLHPVKIGRHSHTFDLVGPLNTEAFDEDGYFRTGDLGTLDADGYVVITGRSKDVIIRNAENISAKEVEDLLYTHPKVHDVAVVGLPDAKTGERVCAVVASTDGDDSLTFADMRDFLIERGLRRQAVPEQLELVDVIPRNAAGKITKNVLRDRFSEQPRDQK